MHGFSKQKVRGIAIREAERTGEITVLFRSLRDGVFYYCYASDFSNRRSEMESGSIEFFHLPKLPDRQIGEHEPAIWNLG